MIVEDLTLIKTIGKGAFGEVYLTAKSGCAEKFATKKVKKSVVMSDKVKKYFNNELLILKQVNHPNIIKLHEIKQTLNNFYLVFDFCNGGGLSNCLEKYKLKHNNKPFPEKTFNISCVKSLLVSSTFITRRFFTVISNLTTS